jgi:hypothetical protein
MHQVLKIVFTITLFFFGFILQSMAQKALFIEKPGTIKYIKKEKGQYIAFKLKNADETIAGKIDIITREGIILKGEPEYSIFDIEEVHHELYGLNLLSVVSLTMGIGYLLLNTFNSIIDSYNSLDNSVLISSGALTGGGLISNYLKTRRIKIDNKKWRLKIVDFQTYSEVKSDEPTNEIQE